MPTIRAVIGFARVALMPFALAFSCRHRARLARHLVCRADRSEVTQLELDEAAHPGTDGDDRVNVSGVGHRVRVIAPPERHRIEREAADGDLATKMVRVGADLPDPEHADAANEQMRSWVAGAAGLQVRQFERETRGE